MELAAMVQSFTVKVISLILIVNVHIIIKLVLPPPHFICPLFHFEMSQNIVLFLKIKVINLLVFLLYPY